MDIDKGSDTGPRVTIRHTDKDHVDFILKDVDLAMANSMRRTMLSEVSPSTVTGCTRRIVADLHPRLWQDTFDDAAV